MPEDMTEDVNLTTHDTSYQPPDSGFLQEDHPEPRTPRSMSQRKRDLLAAGVIREDDPNDYPDDESSEEQQTTQQVTPRSKPATVRLAASRNTVPSKPLIVDTPDGQRVLQLLTDGETSDILGGQLLDEYGGVERMLTPEQARNFLDILGVPVPASAHADDVDDDSAYPPAPGAAFEASMGSMFSDGSPVYDPSTPELPRPGGPSMPDEFVAGYADRAAQLRAARPQPSSLPWGHIAVNSEGYPDVGRTAHHLAGKVGRRAWYAVGPLAFLAANKMRQGAAPIAQGFSAVRHAGPTTRRRMLRSNRAPLLAAALVLLLGCALCSTLLAPGLVSGLFPPTAYAPTATDCLPACLTSGGTETPGGSPTSTDPSATGTSGTGIGSGDSGGCGQNCGGGSGSNPTPTPLPTPVTIIGFCVANCGNPTATPKPTQIVVVAVPTDTVPAGQPTSTPRPTATPAPTATPVPTATPDPHGSSATVTFTRAAQQVAAPSNAWTCDGCSNNAGSGTVAGSRVTTPGAAQEGPSWPTSYQQYQNAAQGQTHLQMACHASNFCNFPAGRQFVGSAGHACAIQSDGSTTPGTLSAATCLYTQVGPFSDNFEGASAGCGTGCSISVAVQTSTQPGQYAASGYFMPGDCMNYDGGGATARNNVHNQLAGMFSGGYSGLAIGQQDSLNYGCSSGGCQFVNPGSWMPGQQASFTQCAYGAAWKLTYDAPSVAGVQLGRVVAPGGYAMDTSTLAVCSSPTVVWTDTVNAGATISCPASGTARYVWGGSQSSALAQALVGKDAGSAQSTIAGWAGVGGNVSVSIAGGKSLMPLSASAITINVQ